jgi:hypothetical protein
MYIYLDADGIDSLYAQTVDRLETEFTQSQERDKSGKIKANMGIGKLLGVMLGLVEVGAETELSISGKRIEEAKMRFTLEQKLSALINYLRNLEGSEYFELLPQAAIQAKELSKGVFIRIAEKFNMPQYSQGNGVGNINRDKSIAFSIGPIGESKHEYDDLYFKKTEYTFLMTTSLSKTTRSKDGMAMTGHDAIYFRQFGGKNVPLEVFGYLIPLSKYTYQIKPYAIWI